MLSQSIINPSWATAMLNSRSIREVYLTTVVLRSDLSHVFATSLPGTSEMQVGLPKSTRVPKDSELLSLS